MKNLRQSSKKQGFTLMETVIAIGVLALLLTSFLAVFGPATQNIRKAISVQEADRLSSTLERELSVLHPGSSTYGTAFEKAFDWFSKSASGATSILIYQYRGTPGDVRFDGTLNPYTSSGGTVGKDYIVQTVARLRSDKLLEDDLKALEGRIFTVKLFQLKYSNGSITRGKEGEIGDMNPDDSDSFSGGDASSYPDAVIAYAADFYIVPNSSVDFVKSGGKFDPSKLKTPVFSRNMAVAR
jgi:prepilin-type N-terminal cleavage/methylation domain-containing protein